MQRLLTLLNDKFESYIINDTNFIIKLKEIESDNWMIITFLNCKTEYNVEKSSCDFLSIFYENLLQQYFIIPKNDIKNIIRVNNKCSKYLKYETSYDSLLNTIINYTNSIKLYKFDIAKSSQLNIKTVLQSSKYTFEYVIELVNQQNCQIISKKTDYIDTKGPLRIKYSCGHEDDTTYNKFMKKCVNKCKNCIYKNLSENNYDYENNADIYSVKESEMFSKIKNILSPEFIVLKTNEGCYADMIIKPIDDNLDRWLPIQLKGSYTEHYQYSFKMKSYYENLVILCYSELDNRYWIFHGQQVKDITNLSMGKKLSKYSTNEVKIDNISEILLESFNNQTLNSHNIIFNTKKYFNTPACLNHIKENLYRERRYEALKDIVTITYPSINNSKTDCLVNDFKIQDKLAYEKTKDLFQIQFLNYKIGDNDIYWIHFQQEEYKNKCILLPESFLEKSGSNELKKYLSIRMVENDPAYKYIFDYTNFDVDKFNRLFDKNNQS
jgi:hypothetical protein